jgi:hypothetical protein
VKAIKRPRLTAIAAVGLLAVIGAGVYSYVQPPPDPAVLRTRIVESGRMECFTNARADIRNTLLPDDKIRAFCRCALERSAAALSDAELRAVAANAGAMTESMRNNLAQATATCRTQVLQ